MRYSNELKNEIKPKTEVKYRTLLYEFYMMAKINEIFMFSCYFAPGLDLLEFGRYRRQ